MTEPELSRAPRTQAGRDAAERLRSRISIAKAIIEARLAKGWTQLQLAEAAGTKQSRISELESIRGNPTLETVDRVLTVLELQISVNSGGDIPTKSDLQNRNTFSTVCFVGSYGPTDLIQFDTDLVKSGFMPPKLVQRAGGKTKQARYA